MQSTFTFLVGTLLSLCCCAGYGYGKLLVRGSCAARGGTSTHRRPAPYRAWYASGKLKLLVGVEALLGWIALGLLIAVALAHLL